MHRSHGWWISLSLSLSFAACAAEPAPPTPQTGDAVGTWRFLPHDPTRTPVDERQVLELHGDGTYAIRDRHGTETGSYELDGHDLTMRPRTGGFVTTGFAATADRLLADALFPDGARADADSVIGRWIGGQASSQTSTEVALELRADGTAHLEQTGELADAADGTWSEDAPYVLLTFASTSLTKPFPVLPGIALGEWLYERIE